MKAMTQKQFVESYQKAPKKIRECVEDILLGQFRRNIKRELKELNWLEEFVDGLEDEEISTIHKNHIRGSKERRIYRSFTCKSRRNTPGNL